MDPKSIVLTEISHTEKDKYCMISLICGILKNKEQRKKAKKTRRVAPEFIDTRTEAGSWEWVKQVKMEGGQKTQTSIYKVNKFWGCDVQHGDNNK